MRFPVIRLSVAETLSLFSEREQKLPLTVFQFGSMIFINTN